MVNEPAARARDALVTFTFFFFIPRRYIIRCASVEVMEKEEEVPGSPRPAPAEKFALVMPSPNGMDQEAGQVSNEIPETPNLFDAAVAVVAAAMGQEAEQNLAEGDAVKETAERPAKRRRGGRRAANPEVSAEERRRIRVLKNRESAMRSLAKKAEYSAKLVDLQKEAEQEHMTKRANLQKLIQTAIGIRDALEKISDSDVGQLFNELSSCIDRSTVAAAPVREEQQQQDALDFAAASTAEPDGVGEPASGISAPQHTESLA